MICSLALARSVGCMIRNGLLLRVDDCRLYDVAPLLLSYVLQPQVVLQQQVLCGLDFYPIGLGPPNFHSTIPGAAQLNNRNGGAGRHL